MDQKTYGLARRALPKARQAQIVLLMALSAAGILAVWLYAAIRPRFGAGPKTAMCAGETVWMLAVAMANAMMAFLHIYPLWLLLTVTAIGLPELLVASVVGAYIYRE